MRWPIARPLVSNPLVGIRMQVNRYGVATATKDLPLVVTLGGSR